MREHGRGLVVPARLRGRSSPAPAVQATRHHTRLTTGATSDGAPPGSAGWRVSFAVPECVMQMRERSVPVDLPLTCAPRPAGCIQVFDLLDPAADRLSQRVVKIVDPPPRPLMRGCAISTP